MNLSRIRRLLKLIGMLQAGRGYNAEALARACEVSRRTIFRDLDALRQSGVPLCYDDQQQRYHIPETYFLPPTNFTPEEVLALIALCHDLGDRGQLPFFEPARTAALKLASSLPERLRQQQYQRLAQQYLSELRRGATIIVPQDFEKPAVDAAVSLYYPKK